MLHRLLPRVVPASRASVVDPEPTVNHTLLERKVSLPYINRISPELLSDIFTHSHQQSENWLTGRVRSDEAPLLLLQVCKYWSAVATATPNLWSNMSYSLTANIGWANVGRAERDSAMINNWFQRSDSPLSLRLDIMYSFAAAERNTHPVLDTFIAYCHRWQTINLSLYERLIPTMNAVKHCPLLRTLEISVAGFSPESPHTLDAFEYAPLLRNVTLHIHPRTIKIPWARITQCSVEGGYECLDIMRQSSNVVTFSLELQEIPRSTILPPIILGSLFTLNIFSHVSDLHPILDHIVAPVLANITFRSSMVYASTQPFPIIPFLSRWSSTLESMTLRHIHLTEQELIRCLRETPLLRTLMIEEHNLSTCVGRTLLRALHPGVSDSLCLVQNLQSMVLEGSFVGFCGEFFVEMVESRSWKYAKVVNNHPHAIPEYAQLKMIVLKSKTKPIMGEEVMRRLDKMNGDGLLDVRICIYD
jgi:hypothetical protein